MSIEIGRTKESEGKVEWRRSDRFSNCDLVWAQAKLPQKTFRSISVAGLGTGNRKGGGIGLITKMWFQ